MVEEFTIEKLGNCTLVTVLVPRLEGLPVGGGFAGPAGRLEEILLGIIQKGQKNVVVNLAHVRHISSAGLKALLQTLLKTRKIHPRGDVVLVALQPAVKGSFDLVGFDCLFKFYNTDDEAVKSFQN